MAAVLGSVSLIASVTAGAGAVLVEAAVPPVGASVTYSATEITPAPPAGSFAGSSGGDGYDLVFWNGNAYNVFHHQGQFIVQCHNTSTAVRCTGYPKTITDGSGRSFTTSSIASLHIDQEAGVLYGFTSRAVDRTPGVVAVDLSSANANPFLSFTALGASNEAKINYVATSMAYLEGSQWYTFNYVPDADASGSKNKIVCFDVATVAPCVGQPYALPDAPATFHRTRWGAADSTTSVTRFGTKLLIPIAASAGSDAGQIYCYDIAVADGDCGGSWPISPTGGGVSMMATGVPVLDADGVQVGVCFLLYDGAQTDAWVNPYCTDSGGAALAAAATALGGVVTGTYSNPVNTAPVVLGTRVYIVQGGEWRGASAAASRVECFSWSTGLECPVFSRVWPITEMSYIYTINPTPGNPTCLWVNGDKGTKQISNFDAYTGGPCGDGGTRIRLGSFVEPTPSCRPTKFLSLDITSPDPSAYTGGTVTFQDEEGAPLASVPVQSIVDGFVDLEPLDLLTADGLPQMLVNLPGAQTSAISMGISWEGPYYEECTDGGQTVELGCDLSGARTLSQGGWSNTASSSPLTVAWFDAEFPTDLTIGGDTNSVTLTTAGAMRAFLPQSGTPAALRGGHRTDLRSRDLKNTLAGQTAALTLNLALTPGMANAELNNGYTGTVAELLEAANEALDGAGSLSRSALSVLNHHVTYVNLSFEAGIDAGRLTCPGVD